MTPSSDHREVVEGGALTAGVVGGKLRRRQHHCGRAVGDAAAVLLAQPPFDDRIQVVVLGEASGPEQPVARLRIRVPLRVGEVDFGDARQVRVVEPVAVAVHVGDLAEEVGPRERRVRRFTADPRRRPQMFRGRLPVDVAHELDTDDQGAVVASRFEVGHRRERGDAARCTGRCGKLAEGRIDRRDESAELRLATEQLSGEVADVSDADVRGGDAGLVERTEHRLGHQLVEIATGCGPVAGEVRLGAPQDVDVLVAHQRGPSFHPGTHVAWKPIGTRWGRSTRPTGSAVRSDASRMTTSLRSSSWSYTKLTR